VHEYTTYVCASALPLLGWTTAFMFEASRHCSSVSCVAVVCMCLMELGTLISEAAGLDAGLLTSRWSWAHCVVRCFFVPALM
jgi:hypothetical protein